LRSKKLLAKSAKRRRNAFVGIKSYGTRIKQTKYAGAPCVSLLLAWHTNIESKSLRFVENNHPQIGETISEASTTAVTGCVPV
jgi:hypothetical protein